MGAPRRTHLAGAAGIAAALLVASAAGAQPKPAEPEADVEIPAAPAAAPPPPAAPAPARPTPAAPAPAPPSPAAPAPAPPPPAAPGGEVEALRREMRAEQARLGAQIAALQAEVAAARKAPEPSSPPAPPAGGPLAGGATPLASLLGAGAWGLGAYVQAQYEHHQDSEDQIQQGGVYLNQDRFLVRRGRIQLDAAWRWVDLAIQIDANTARGPGVFVKRAEASLVWRRGPWEAKLPARGPRAAEVPYARLTVGLTDIPFGFELQEAARDRVFVERTLASQALFPGERDVGVVLSGGVGFFRYALAATNGEPADDRGAKAVGDPNRAKDLVLRLGADARPLPALRVTGGVSALYGRGFHAGTDATKDSVQWNDLNQDGMVQPNELTAAPGTAATPSASFSRWGLGADLEVRFETPLGWTRIYGEATLATNLDRGLFVADPVATGIDVRHLGAYGAILQEITPYGIVGFRFDYYDPNADFFDRRGGKLLPSSQAVKTFSPLVGLQLPDRARLVFQYDAVRDLFARDQSGVPTDLENDRFTLRLQVQM